MGDIICRRCGEPWDSWGVFHGDLTKEEVKKLLKGEGCPCCKYLSASQLTEAEQQEVMALNVEELMYIE